MPRTKKPRPALSTEPIGRIEYAVPDKTDPCPRCKEPCRWWCAVTVWNDGQIGQVALYMPVCSCPDEHIWKPIVDFLAKAAVEDYLKKNGLQPLDV
jgi:hypothetical protein